MPKDKQQQNGGTYKLFLQAACLAWGLVPSPAATVPMLQAALKSRCVDFGSLDPEVPDDLLSLLVPALRTRGMSDVFISDVVRANVTVSLANQPPVTDISPVVQPSVIAASNQQIASDSFLQAGIGYGLLGPLGMLLTSLM